VAATTFSLTSNFFTKYDQVCSPFLHEPIAMIPGDMLEISLIIEQNFVLDFSFQGLLK
jgi:hypothetical protein